MHTATFFNGCQYHQSLFFSKVCSTVVSKEHRITVYCKGLSEPKGFGSGDGKGKGSKHAKGLTKKAFGTARPRRAVALEEGSPQFKKLLKEVEKDGALLPSSMMVCHRIQRLDNKFGEGWIDSLI
eukprot:Gb_14733 [translate_table: standard]